MVLQIMSGTDLTLYKFMDVHFFILDREDSLDWDLMFEEAEILGRLNDIYYTLYYTEELYPGTVCKKIWKNSNQNQRIFSMNTKEEIIQKKFINGI